MRLNRNFLSPRLALLIFLLVPTGCGLLTKEIYVGTDQIGYCAAWPSPPIIPSDRDTPETREQADRINADWRRRCPDEWRAWSRANT